MAKAKYKIDEPILPFPSTVDREYFANYLPGLVDGEGCFSLRIAYNNKEDENDLCKHFWNFNITMRADDIGILKLIQSFFGAGNLGFVEGDKTKFVSQKPRIEYRITGLDNLVNSIAAFFDSHPLYANKRNDFAIWSKAVKLAYEIKRKPVRECAGTIGAFGYKRWNQNDEASLKDLVSQLKEAREYKPLVDIVPPAKGNKRGQYAIHEPIIQFPSNMDRNRFAAYISGFVDGEGCFNLRRITPNEKNYSSCGATFHITLREDEINILRIIRSFFGVGTLQRTGERGTSKPKVCYNVSKTSDLNNVIVPHFDNFPLLAKKSRDFLHWKEGVHLIHKVITRRCRPLIFKRGSYPKWTDDEITQFVVILDSLKTVRKYKSIYEPLLLQSPKSTFIQNTFLFPDDLI